MNPPVTRTDLVEESGFKRHGVVSSSVKVVSWKGGTKKLCRRIETSPCSFSMGLKALAAGAALSSATSREQDKLGDVERARGIWGVPGGHCDGGPQAGGGVLRSGGCMALEY